MLDRALLALPDERRPRYDHGQHRKIADDLDDWGEPTGIQIRIELCAGNHFYRRAYQSFTSRNEFGRVIDDDVLDVGHAIENLSYRGGIYIDLNRRLPPGKNIRLKLWGKFNDVNEALRIHRCVHFCYWDFRH